MPVRKAIILAAGLGTRLRPLTATVPKPLLPVWGEPMIGRIASVLRGWGVEEIAANTHYLPFKTERWCAENSILARREEKILGTGGAVANFKDFIDGEPFYLVNADIIIEGVDKNPFTLESHPGSGVAGADLIGECIVTHEGPRTIEVSPEGGLVTCWKSPDPGCSGTWTYAGVALLKPEILGYIPEGVFSTIVEAYEKASMDGKFVRAIAPGDLSWDDAGTVESYIEINRHGADNAYAALPQLAAAAAATGKFDPAGVRFLGARGSDRCFFASKESVAVVYDDSKRAENARYASLSRWLKSKGAPVPEIYADLPEEKTVVMENAGAEKKMELSDYVKVVEALAGFGSLPVAEVETEPPFSPELWKWEIELFERYALRERYGMDMPAAAAAEFEKIAVLLEAEPKGLVHRDFQSTNIMWKGGDFKFIDYQGMRPGPVVYDLASLLYDPYAGLEENDRAALARIYADKCARPGIVKILPFAAVQRLAQCAGAFGRLASVGRPEFTRFTMSALERLLAAADEAGLDAVGALAEDLIARETKLSAGRRRHHRGCTCGACADASEGGRRL